jgi:hypothetical protein
MESPESWFHRRATYYVESQILFHLNQAGVFGLFSSGEALSAAEIAASLRLDPGPTAALLDYVFEVDDLFKRDEQGKYSLSEFGNQVVERFSGMKGDSGSRAINMFDVRVGAYGPVWQNLGRMLAGAGKYGEDFHREGRYAENGVSKLAMRFWNILTQHTDEFSPDRVVEVGVTTGLVQRLAQQRPARVHFGLDRSGRVLREAAETARLANLCWIESDFFDLERWCETVGPQDRGLIYSLHFHELIARGENAFVDTLRELRSRLPGWSLLAFEQPRLPHSEKAQLAETLWLYAQSNILIHHLIGNGRILSREAWIDLGRQAGCREVTERPCNYLGYQAFHFHF